MCDCCSLECEDCSKRLPVHIGDFCTGRDNVLVRCSDHPPTKDGMMWLKFTNCNYQDEEYGDWCMTCADYSLVDTGYCVGEAGDIIPNCDWDEEIRQ